MNNTVTIPRELFEWLIEYTVELRGVSEWKRNSTLKNDHDMIRLDAHIEQAIAARDEGKP